MANKENTILYDIYGKQYNYNDLQKSYDLGLQQYIKGLNKGDKYYQELISAGNDIMQGIKDGSVKFENGRFIDSKGRYTNNEDKKKDFYGLMANYIYGMMGKSDEYIPPTDQSKIKWNGSDSLARAINQEIFNADSGNVQDFIDLDQYNSDTKSRDSINRVNELRRVFNSIRNNFSSKFSDYQDSDYQSTISNIDNILNNVLKDNRITQNEYLLLNRLTNGIDWRQMFGDNPPQATDTQQQQNSYENTQQTNPNKRDTFIQWMKSKYPNYSGQLYSPISIQYSSTISANIADRLKQALNNASDSEIANAFSNSLKYDNYSLYQEPFIKKVFGNTNPNLESGFSRAMLISMLKNRNLLSQFSDNPNLYYIKSSLDSNRNTGWVYDEKNKQLKEYRRWDIPFLRQQMVDEFNSTYNPDSNTYSDPSLSWVNDFFYKEGGILKAETGLKLWYSGLQDVDPNSYTSEYDVSNLINGDLRDNDRTPWVSNKHGNASGRYLPSEGNDRKLMQEVEAQEYYNTFGADLFDQNGNLTPMGVQWAKLTDAQLPSGSLATFYDENGQLRKSWTVTNNDIYGREPHTFNNVYDYVNYVRNDQIKGGRHNVFGKVGNRYFYKDQDGVKHYVDPSVINDYVVSESPVEQILSDDHTTLWNDYELTGLKSPNPSTEDTPKQEEDIQDDSVIYPWQQNKSDNKRSGSKLNDVLSWLGPEMLGGSRLLLSLDTNNRIAKVLRNSLQPMLYDTYERFSPVTGAFSEMQFLNNQASDLQRQQSQPVTSDSSLQLARQLEASRYANNIRHQGFIADDKEIRRTKQESLARQEDNMARRSAVSNKNRESLNQNEREKAQLEASRLNRNWISIDNFLKGVEQRARQEYETNRNNKRNFMLQTATSDIEQQYQDAISKPTEEIQKWQNDPENSGKPITQAPGYQTYQEFLRAMSRWKLAHLYKTHANIYGYSYDNDLLETPVEAIQRKFGYKLGGTLKPSIQYLINKTISNENNT